MSVRYSRKLGTELTFDTDVASVQMRMSRVCGPKLSNCCFIISIWGIIMLVLLGIFFKVKSVALIEDVPFKKVTTLGKTKEIPDYSGTSTNCFIAAGVYGVTFIISAYQKYAIN